MVNASTISVAVLRQHPKGQETCRWDSYQVPVFDNMRVLDALFWVQQNLDPTLAFRWACRVGMCGSCGVIINGVERLACRTTVSDVGPVIRLEPLRHLPVVKDLVVDRSPFLDRYRQVMPYFVSADPQAAPARIPPGSRVREVIDEQRECIACALCFSACPIVGLGSDYLGPAALNRTYCLVADTRDGTREARLTRVAHERGLWRCHYLFNCADVCPKNIIPTQAIQRLKGKTVAWRLRRLLNTLWRRGRM
jgi:succinate dehydrogenase/fumarate reductase iron-sulfur protein